MEKTEEIRMNSNKDEKLEIVINLNLLSLDLQLTMKRRPKIYKFNIYNLKDEPMLITEETYEHVLQRGIEFLRRLSGVSHMILQELHTVLQNLVR